MSRNSLICVLVPAVASGWKNQSSKKAWAGDAASAAVTVAAAMSFLIMLGSPWQAIEKIFAGHFRAIAVPGIQVLEITHEITLILLCRLKSLLVCKAGRHLTTIVVGAQQRL